MRLRADRETAERSMSGSDRCFASPNALMGGEPRAVGPRRPAPASLCARQPPQIAPRRHSLSRVRHAGVDLHIAGRGRGDLELSSTRIEIRRCAKRSPTAAVPPLRPSGSLVPSSSDELACKHIAEVARATGRSASWCLCLSCKGLSYKKPSGGVRLFRRAEFGQRLPASRV